MPPFRATHLLCGLMLVSTAAGAAPRTAFWQGSSTVPAVRARRHVGFHVSPCGRHALRVKAGTVFVDGIRVHRPDEHVQMVASPSWRGDGRAVAWLERTPVGMRLAVVVDIARPDAPMFWSLPAPANNEHLAWAGPHRVIVGNDILSPRAVASWTEDEN